MKFAFLDDSESHRVLVEAYFGDGISVFSECSDEFIGHDVLLIDYLLGADNGLYIARDIKEKHPSKPIYMITAYDLECELPVIPKGDMKAIVDVLRDHGVNPSAANLLSE